ncbi:MAG: leucine-rich repeat protein [Oscillospiraceae bacterium]|nr:leucine-rich repeat protein [Oscillospiraceae bacterium]
MKKRIVSLMLTAAMLTGLLSILGMTAFAAAGDVFALDGIEYKVLTVSGNTGTVQVGIDSLNDQAVPRTTQGELTIPATVSWAGITYTVSSIGDLAFYCCSILESVTIPSSISNIGDLAFSNCISLTSVTIPNSVTRIGTCAFSSCSSLTNVTIPNSVTNIGNESFYACENLTSAYFYGRPPALFGSYVFDDTAPEFTIYYLSSQEGWTTPTWNGYRSEPFDTIKFGDLNGDGVVDIFDMLYLARHLAGWPSYESITVAADVNGDGVVDVFDALYLARYLTEWPGYEILGSQ